MLDTEEWDPAGDPHLPPEGRYDGELTGCPGQQGWAPFRPGCVLHQHKPVATARGHEGITSRTLSQPPVRSKAKR
jgi:hypothetical protein